MEYCSFIWAFVSLIETQTFKSTERLLLEQYTAGNSKELVRSCHHVFSGEGYAQAQNLLKRKLGMSTALTRHTNPT